MPNQTLQASLRVSGGVQILNHLATSSPHSPSSLTYLNQDSVPPRPASEEQQPMEYLQFVKTCHFWVSQRARAGRDTFLTHSLSCRILGAHVMSRTIKRRKKCLCVVVWLPHDAVFCGDVFCKTSWATGTGLKNQCGVSWKDAGSGSHLNGTASNHTRRPANVSALCSGGQSMCTHWHWRINLLEWSLNHLMRRVVLIWPGESVSLFCVYLWKYLAYCFYHYTKLEQVCPASQFFVAVRQVRWD